MNWVCQPGLFHDVVACSLASSLLDDPPSKPSISESQNVGREQSRIEDVVLHSAKCAMRQRGKFPRMQEPIDACFQCIISRSEGWSVRDSERSVPEIDGDCGGADSLQGPPTIQPRSLYPSIGYAFTVPLSLGSSELNWFVIFWSGVTHCGSSRLGFGYYLQGFAVLVETSYSCMFGSLILKGSCSWRPLWLVATLTLQSAY